MPCFFTETKKLAFNDDMPVFFVSVDTQIFFQRKAGGHDGRSCGIADIADMPWLIHITGDMFFSRRITKDEAIVGTMCGEPAAGIGLSVIVVDAADVEGQTALMLRLAWLGRISVGRFFAVSGNIAIVKLRLIFCPARQV